MYKTLSLVAIVLMALALASLIVADALFSWSPVVLLGQGVATSLMLWARWTFGRRSFHATAPPTTGGVVHKGPYRVIRHPIYTAVCLFVWSGIIAHWSCPAVLCGLLVTGGALVRMWCEEHCLAIHYPEYRAYARVTKRMLPYIF